VAADWRVLSTGAPRHQKKRLADNFRRWLFFAIGCAPIPVAE
jgi:hypothetical protein